MRISLCGVDGDRVVAGGGRLDGVGEDGDGGVSDGGGGVRWSDGGSYGHSWGVGGVRRGSHGYGGGVGGVSRGSDGYGGGVGGGVGRVGGGDGAGEHRWCVGRLVGGHDGGNCWVLHRITHVNKITSQKKNNSFEFYWSLKKRNSQTTTLA